MSKLTAQDVLDYEKAVADLATAKKNELELRNKIIKSFRYKKQEGVEHKSVEGLDIDIAITLGLRRSVDAHGLDMVWDDLTLEQQEAIKRTPSVVNSKFKKLVEAGEAGELVKIITEKPSQATVKLKFEES